MLGLLPAEEESLQGQTFNSFWTYWMLSALSERVQRSRRGGEGLVRGFYGGKGCAQKGFTLPAAPRGHLENAQGLFLPRP